jgi:hypothetical protein
MIFKQYDINVVDTFINKGMFGDKKIEADDTKRLRG